MFEIVPAGYITVSGCAKEKKDTSPIFLPNLSHDICLGACCFSFECNKYTPKPSFLNMQDLS